MQLWAVRFLFFINIIKMVNKSEKKTIKELVYNMGGKKYIFSYTVYKRNIHFQ